MGHIAESLRNLGAQPVAVAVSGTFSQVAFADHLGIDVPLLSDWDGEVADLFGVRYKSWLGHAGVAKRSVFVIDTLGVIQYRWVTEDALDLPDLGEAAEIVSKLSTTTT